MLYMLIFNSSLRDFSDREGSSFYIIPSSIHELLLLPVEDDSDSAEIKDMIKDVNDTQVSEEEILSYSLYYYDREKGDVTML